MTVQNVDQQSEHSEYGILIYDIPEQHQKLYYRIQSKIRAKAIRLNWSVYLCLWGMRDDLAKIIDEAQEETGQYATVFFAKFDNSEETAIRRAAKESLIVEVNRVAKRLLDTVAKTRAKMEKENKEFKHIREAYASRIKKRLEEADALAMLFGLTHDIKHALETAQKIFAIEMTKILAGKEEQRATKKAEKTSKKAKEKNKLANAKEKLKAMRQDETQTTLPEPDTAEVDEAAVEETDDVEVTAESGSWADSV